ncbi:uncharacterized protein KY384_001362 [Bacidia gigantensis]|uniref:uncharacterized protein n=1 Tax=Bacidia gigantensis TaxID=2732470 RepID=UPI001D0385A0|nr:uncharacterized protein KY384_001362 [Bacidia gigantensis]KAG8533622.1 hypothetical protein KY384_001362 [Bacidia gigantensis]
MSLYNFTLNNDPRITSILEFWFNPEWMHYPYLKWFTPDPKFDAEIAHNFATLVSLARTTTSLDSWANDSPEGSLALIILLDKFPRNLYSRSSAKAFSSDGKALGVAQRAVKQGLEGEVGFVEQVFFYLPYMHAEDLEVQNQSVELYQALADRGAGGDVEKWLVECVDFAKRHQRVIQLFGRFPARNEVLGRKSTEAEVEFLKTHPSGY